MFHFIHHNKKLYNAGTMKVERVEMFEKLLTLCEDTVSSSVSGIESKPPIKYV